MRSGKKVSKIKNFFKIFGPGVITGAADDDPSGITFLVMFASVVAMFYTLAQT